MKITVLGSGSWGTAISRLLALNNHEVSVWSRDEKVLRYIANGENPEYLPGIPIPKNIKTFSDFDGSLKGSEVIVLAVPSQAVRSVAENIKYNNQIIVNLSKGIEIKTGKLINQVVEEVLGKNTRYATLSGPSHAEEVSRDIPTSVVIAGNNQKDNEIIQEAFSNVAFRVYTNDDVNGVELSGSIKNVYAIGAGIIDGLGGWDNTKAALITRSIVEMKRVGNYYNSNPDTFNGLAGLGDLIVTCTSQHSRNRHVGEFLGRGKKTDEILSSMNMVAEGVYTAKALHSIIKNNNFEMPIAEKIYQVIYEVINPKKAIRDLMNRDLKSES